MIDLEATQECPVFSRIPPGVYHHLPESICEYCLCAEPECAYCGGMGPYRPLVNVAINRPLEWRLGGAWDERRYRK